MRKIFLSFGLLLILLLESRISSVTGLGSSKTSSNEKPSGNETALARSELRVELRTATGKTILFKGQEADEVEPETPTHEIPHLVLRRNGVPTPGFERTLQVSVGNLVVPPSGIYVQLVIETQHGDPDLDRKSSARIRVRKETIFVPYRGTRGQEASVQFNVRFDSVTKLREETIKTPTDYYRCRITLLGTQGEQLGTYVHNYAFLLENQWRVPLPDVLEATPGAAPDELLVYYYDMTPFQADLRDPDTRIPRQEVERYIQTELMPAMVEAFQIQSNIWEFPWYAEWRNYRREEAPKILSVALGEQDIWFHGKPASLGHSMISIRVDGTTGEYDSLTDGIMSVFHHELFHNHQRNISLHYSKHAVIAGKDDAWMMFTEGTAVLASAVGQPAVQFKAKAQPRSYVRRVNAFLGSETSINSGLNKSYADIPYQTALYWRFLYENCGGVTPAGEDPSTGMKVIRHALETLYRGEIVQVNFSTDLARAFPLILDEALRSTPSCKFQSYEESLAAFARAIYLLRLEDGRCQNLMDLSRCGFADPHHLYQAPPAATYSIEAEKTMAVNGSIPSSYGIDLIELQLSPSMQGKSLKLVFSNLADPHTDFHVQVWKTTTVNGDPDSERHSTLVTGPISTLDEDGSLILNLTNMDSTGYDGLGLIVTRTDPYEDADTAGAYSIQWIAE